MKNQILFAVLAVAALSAAAAEPKEEVVGAAKKLGDQANYSWRTTVVVPEDAQFKPGPTDGKTEKDGFTDYKINIFDNTMEVVTKGDKAAFTNQEGEWKTPAEVEGEQGPGRFAALMVRNLRVPAVQAAEIAEGVKELKAEGDVYSGDLTEEAAKNLMRFRRGGGDGPSVSNAKGSAKFWVTDGALTKYEYKVTGTMNFNGNDIDIDRTTTVQIKDVGSTKVEVPEGAKKKLS